MAGRMITKELMICFLLCFAGAIVSVCPSSAEAGGDKDNAEFSNRVNLFDISRDGKTVTIKGKTFQAGDGLTFLRRGDNLFVVSVEPDAAFLEGIEVRPSKKFTFPRSKNYKVVGRKLVIRRAESKGMMHVRNRHAERLADSGQMYPYRDRYFLTKHYERPTWQALYVSRAENNDEYPEIRKRVAMSLIIRLLQEGVPAKGFDRGLKRLNKLIDRAWRGFNQGLLGKQIMQTLDYDFEILEDGKVLVVGGRAFRAGPGISFIYCTIHGVHIIGNGPGAFEYPVQLVGNNKPRKRLKSTMFFIVKRNRILARKPSRKWKWLVKLRQVQFRDGHYRLTLAYQNPEFQAMLQAASNNNIYSERIRERASTHLLAILKRTFEPWSREALDGAIRELDERIHLRYQDLVHFMEDVKTSDG
ncbi:MAG: hypothetical protein GXP49_12080 [Deltaproteobacteria bacterium]|nr:hypothetical protein [Deltaproteobacteria bacterium]